MPYQPAVLGPNTRLNNFRLNYLTADQVAERPTHIRVILGGIDITTPDAPTRVIYKSMSIQDRVYDEPNTCALTLYGAAPSVGTPIEVWVNSNAPVLLFNGELQTVEKTYKGQPSTVLHAVTAIDDTARANRRRPLMPFVNVSATTIAHTLITTFAPGFSVAGVQLGLPAVTITFDGSEGGMKGCLTALAKLIGAYWYFEAKTLYFFVTPPGTAPDPIDETPGRFLHDPAITWTHDKSQVRTRVYGKGASTAIATTIAAATDLVPVREATMFNPAGGKAIAGLSPDAAASRILTYTGVQLGGGGGLVGPGAAPSAPPALAPLDGAGMEGGAHGYGYTFVTAAGESLVSPVSRITVGPTAPPAAAVVPGSATAGGAVDAGSHSYVATFVTAAGETTGTPLSAAVTTIAGTSIPTPGATEAALRGVSGNLAVGVAYRYRATFTATGGGETLPGAVSAAIMPVAPAAPTSVNGGHGVNGISGGDFAIGQLLFYQLAYVAGGYETAFGPQLNFQMPNDPLVNAIDFGGFAVSPDPRVTARRLYRAYGGVWRLVTTLNNTFGTLYVDRVSDISSHASRGIEQGPIGTPPGDQATVTVPTSGDPRTAGRRLYRSDQGAAYKFLGSIGNNTATLYVDNTASVVGQDDAPTSDTSGSTSYQTVPIGNLPVGPANVTARRLYRQFNGTGQIQLVATIANNTATTYTDTTANSALGAPVPNTNTAIASQVHVTVPVGGAGVTSRQLYRSKANVDPLQLRLTLFDNTTTTVVDAGADGTLLAQTPPTVDTSGLTQPSGQVPAGATTIVLANPAAFAASGGWAVVGNGEQVIRYTGKTATSLTGIPPTGPGSLSASVSYNSTITVAPALVGVAGILEQILTGAPVHVWVQRDDLAAQAAMAALDGGGDGVYEHIWSDERRAEASLIQVCDAQLALYSRPLVTVTYATRDLKTKSGKTVLIVLSSPAIQASLPIQDVTITELGIKGLLPKFTVTASNARQSFEAILQMLIRKADA
jgi:hypothetical protein